MKKFITSIAAATILICSMPGCKKSSDTQQPPQTTLQKIQAKWFLATDVYNDHYSGTDHIVTQLGANDYVEFKTDGNVFSSVSGSTNTTTYSLISDTKLKVDTDIYDIKTLTSNSFILYIKTLYSGSDYDEETITFKK